MLCRRNGMANCHGTKGMWVDRILDPCCDFQRKGMWVGYDVGCTVGLTLGHGAWQIDRPSNGSMWNSYNFQPVAQWMGYLFTDLGAEGCCHSLNILFVHVLRYQFETWYIHLVGSATHRGRVSSQSGHSELLCSQKWVNVIFLHLWLEQLYRAFRFGTPSYIASVLNCTDFCHGWAIFGPLVATNTQKGDLSRAPHHRNVFFSFFSACFEIWTWNLVYTSGRWHNTSSLNFITIRSRPLESFPDFFLNVLRCQFESWFIHSVGCTTYWVHVSPEWGPCDQLHVLSLGTVN